MNSVKYDTLRVPGAILAYEVRGNGPILLLISGGGNDARSFDSIVGRLLDQYTVVTYDRRGLSRSTLDDPQEEQRVETHSDDAHRLLKALSSDYEPAYVFGSSGGAVVGLDLVARHPEQIYTLISHEPPTHLLPEHDPVQEMGAIREVYFREGVAAAFRKLMEMPGLRYDNWEGDIELPVVDDAALEAHIEEDEHEQDVNNLKFLFEREFAMYDRYQLDFAALKQASTQARIVLAGGHDNKEDATFWSASAVADRLDSTLVEFPGRHVGYVTNPEAFARRLHEVLSA